MKIVGNKLVYWNFFFTSKYLFLAINFVSKFKVDLKGIV